MKTHVNCKLFTEAVTRCFSLTFILLALLCHGQTVPNLINYQGKLTDAGGAPLPNGTYGIAVKLWSKRDTNQLGNALIWGQEYNVAVQNGIFNVILGSPGGTPIGGAAVNDLSFAFTDAERYFGLTVTKGTNGIVIPNASEIVPRQQILSAPFAIRAVSASSANTANALNAPNGGPANAVFVAANGNVGVGSTNPLLPLEVNGTIKAASFVGDGSQLTGLPRPSVSSQTSFSAGTTYQNGTPFKQLVFWRARCSPSGGWYYLNQEAKTGQVSPDTLVANLSFVHNTPYAPNFMGCFVVPPGWFWRIDISDAEPGRGGGSVEGINVWQIQ